MVIQKNNVFKNPILQNEYHIKAIKNMFRGISINSFIIFTDSDPALIFKGFQLGKPICCYDPKNREELTFLLSKGLIVRAKEPIDIVDCLYALLETNKKESLTQAGLKWVEFADISNIANYVCAYINTDD